MLIDGEKWACEACVRGHRVSNCQHADRPLQHINKKGRPVSQCQHCRSMRKSRASHVKCDCGEKTSKCAHLQTTVEGHSGSCCCNHGARCTCAHKKEQALLGTVPETESDDLDKKPATTRLPLRGAARARRRAATYHNDSLLSFDENGNRKPTQRQGKTPHRSGAHPLNRVNSMHAGDSLAGRSMDNLLHAPSLADLQPHDTFASAAAGLFGENRMVKSEAASPMMSGRSQQFGSIHGLQPLDLSSIEYQPYVPDGNAFSIFGKLSEHDQPMFSAGLNGGNVDWSHYDGLDFGNKSGDNFAPSNYSQAQSYGFDFNGSEQQPPTLTTSNSGEVSEVEDFMATANDDFEPVFSRQNTSTSGFNLAGPSDNMMNTTPADVHNMDYEGDFLSMKNKFLPTPTSNSGEEASLMAPPSAPPNALDAYSSLVEDDPAFWMGPDYNHALPVMNETPDPNEVPFWSAQ